MNELEQRLLHGLISSNHVAMDFSLQYDQRLFLDTEARIIAKIIIDYVKAYKCKPNKRILLDINKDSTEICKLIEDLFDSEVKFDEADYKYDLNQLKETYKKHKYTELKNLDTNAEDISYGLNQVQSVLNEIKIVDKTQAFNRKTLKEHVNDFKLQYKAKMESPEIGQGILTGYSYLDYTKNGIVKDELLIVCGESASGKSVFLNNIALNMWKQQNTLDTKPGEYTKGYNISFFSLEMGLEDIYNRSICALSDVKAYNLRDTCLTHSEGVSVGKACRFFKNYPYEFDIIDVPRGFTVEQLELQLEQIKTKYTPDCIFIDYMGLMAGLSESNEDWLKLGELAGQLHEFSRTHQIPIISACQLTRIDKSKVKKQEYKEIGLHRIGRSSMIAHHCSLILQIQSDHEIDDFKYHIIKNRHGECGSHNIRKNFANNKIIDMLYDSSAKKDFTMTNDDISADLTEILGLISDE